MDDILIATDNKHIADHTNFAITTITNLVFIINYKKWSLVPSSRIEYVGYIYDSSGPVGCPWVYISTKNNQIKLTSCQQISSQKMYGCSIPCQANILHFRTLFKDPPNSKDTILSMLMHSYAVQAIGAAGLGIRDEFRKWPIPTVERSSG